MQYISDQYSAIGKRKVSQSMREGYDADTPMNFGKCLCLHDGLQNVVVFVGYIENVSTEDEPNELEGIQSYHEFLFEEGKLISNLVKLTKSNIIIHHFQVGLGAGSNHN